MCPKIVDKDAKKDAILAAAMRVMAKRGYRDVTIAEIAQAAGIGKGTVYEYFSGKEELFGAAFDKFQRDVARVQAKTMKNLTDPSERLKALIDSWVDVLQGSSYGHLELLTDFWTEGIRNGIMGKSCLFDIKGVYSNYRNQVVSIIESGIKKGTFRRVNPFGNAAVLIGALDGIILQWMLDKDSVDIQHLAKTVFDTFLSGISVER
jgi:AcrR family transcriptional regulator